LYEIVVLISSMGCVHVLVILLHKYIVNGEKLDVFFASFANFAVKKKRI